VLSPPIILEYDFKLVSLSRYTSYFLRISNLLPPTPLHGTHLPYLILIAVNPDLSSTVTVQGLDEGFEVHASPVRHKVGFTDHFGVHGPISVGSCKRSVQDLVFPQLMEEGCDGMRKDTCCAGDPSCPWKNLNHSRRLKG